MKEKGSVTIIVITTIFFLLIILGTIFTTMSFKRKSQLAELEQLKEAYDGDMGEVYEKKHYIEDGLVLWCDGINNTKNGHNSNASTWEDLSGNNNNVELVNFNNTVESGWGENCLTFDGINDYGEVEKNDTLRPLDQTIEIVVDRTGIAEGNADSTKRGIIFVLWEGYTVELNRIDESNQYTVSYGRQIGATGNYLRTGLDFKLNQKYSIVATHKNNTSKIYKNANFSTERNAIPTAYNMNTNLTIGTWLTSKAFTKCKIYSIRMYNRALTEEEIQHNYLIDKARFDIQE